MNPIYNNPHFWLAILALFLIGLGNLCRQGNFNKNRLLKSFIYLGASALALGLFLVAVNYGTRTSCLEGGAYSLLTPGFKTIFKTNSLLFSFIQRNSVRLAGYGTGLLLLSGLLFLIFRRKAGIKFFWAAFSLAIGIMAQRYLLDGDGVIGFQLYLLAITGAFLFSVFPGLEGDGDGKTFKIPFRAAMGILLIMALLIGFYRLDELPRFDEFEATNAIVALQFNEGDQETQNFIWTYFPRSYGADSCSSAIFTIFPALLFRIEGVNLFVFRSVPVFWGVLSILLLYILTNQLFGSPTALLAAFLFGISSWHIAIFRHGMFGSLSISYALLIFIILFKALRSYRIFYYLLLGFSLSFYGYFYLPVKLLFPLIIIMFIYKCVLTRKFFRKNWLGIFSFFIIFFVFFSFQTPDLNLVADTAYKSSKGGSIFPFIGSETRADMAIKWDIVPGQLLKNFQTLYLGLCVNRPGGSFTYPPAGPLISRIVFLLAMLGIGYSLFRWKREEYFFLLIWLAIALFPFLVLIDTIGSAPRHIMLGIPLLYVFSSLYIMRTIREFNRLLKGRGRFILMTISSIALTTLLLILSTSNLSFYFQQPRVDYLAPGLHVRDLLSRGYYLFIHLAEHERTIGPARPIDFLAYSETKKLYHYHTNINRYYDYHPVAENPRYTYLIGISQLSDSVIEMAGARKKTGVLVDKQDREALEKIVDEVLPGSAVNEILPRHDKVIGYECLFDGRGNSSEEETEELTARTEEQNMPIKEDNLKSEVLSSGE